MTEQDPHAPTTAGPTPVPEAEPGAVAAAPADEAAAIPEEPLPEAEPTPAVPPSEGTWERPAGTAAPGAGGPSADAGGLAEKAEERPEILVGAAFAGGLVAALILRRITLGGR